MTETVAVIFIFFVLVVFGLIFYSKFRDNAIIQKQEELEQARLIDTTLKTIYLPELICSRGEAVADGNCVDLMKAKHFNTLTKEKSDYYFSIFGFSKVVLHQVYPPVEIPPEDSDEKPKFPMVLYDKKKPALEQSATNKLSGGLEKTFYVVAIREYLGTQREPTQYFGYLEIDVYT